MRLLLDPANFANFLAQASEIASEICSHLFRMAVQKSDLASTLQLFFPALFRAELQGFLQGFFPSERVKYACLDKLATHSPGSAEAASWRGAHLARRTPQEGQGPVGAQGVEHNAVEAPLERLVAPKDNCHSFNSVIQEFPTRTSLRSEMRIRPVALVKSISNTLLSTFVRLVRERSAALPR
jgi:hypothetical protein